MGRSLAWLLGVALALGCNARQLEPELACVSVRVLALRPYAITPSRLLLEQFESQGPLIVSRLDEGGSTSEVATLEAGDRFEDFAHDPATGRMWLVEPGDYPKDTPARLYQFDSTGKLEWERELIHEGRVSMHGNVYPHDDTIYLATSLEPLEPYEFGDPHSLLIQRLDHAGEVAWSRMDYPVPNEPDAYFASGGDMHMSDAGLTLLGHPPSFEYSAGYPFTIDVTDGTPLWMSSEGRLHMRSIAEDDRVDLLIPTPPTVTFDNQTEPVPRSVLKIQSPTGELRTTSEVEWPGWDSLYTSPAFFGDRILTLVVSGRVGQVGVTVHAQDGTLEWKDILDELDGAGIESAVGLAGREQVAAIAMLVSGDPPDHDYERVVLLIGAPLD